MSCNVYSVNLYATNLPADVHGVNILRVHTKGTSRSAYHHGDLRNALIEAGIGQARTGGPEAVVLRAAAREAGVSPTAAYRHFANRQELLHAIKLEALTRMGAVMKRELASGKPLPDPVAEAERRLRALGAGYFRYAVEDPGLFRTGFCHEQGYREGDDPWSTFQDIAGALPFAMLTEALDALAAHGALPPARRPHAELAAWSAVHGMTTLHLDGILDMLPKPERALVVTRTLDMVVAGLTAPA